MKGPDLQGHLGAIEEEVDTLSEFWDTWLDTSPWKLDWRRGMEAHTGALLLAYQLQPITWESPSRIWPCGHTTLLGKEKETPVPALKQELPSLPLCSQRDHPCVQKARALQELSSDIVASSHLAHLDVPF